MLQPRRQQVACLHYAMNAPPAKVELDLGEALDLMAALEDARDVLIQSDHLAVLAQVEQQIERLSDKVSFG